MTKAQIAHLNASYGTKRAKDVIGRTLDEGFYLVENIPHGQHTIDLEVVPCTKQGTRMCMVEGWTMASIGPDDEESIQYTTTGPFPLETPLTELLSVALLLIAVLEAHAVILPKYAQQMYRALSRGRESQRDLLMEIDGKIVELVQHRKKHRKTS